MRLGGPVSAQGLDARAWAEAARARGYGAAVWPFEEGEDEGTLREFVGAAHAADLVIAEVGAWSNPLSPHEPERRAALARCQERLALADEVGARCCVNIAGSLSGRWDGPHPHNLSEDTFSLVVESVRAILDAVKPRRTYYTLETMPWAHPDSPDSYLRLLRAVGHERFAVHLDPVNLVSSPRAYYGNAALIRACFDKLGPFIKSCHAKDVRLRDDLTVHLEEVRPGLGALDYPVFLRELDRLDRDTPLVLEHLSGDAEYARAAEHLRGLAGELGVDLR